MTRSSVADVATAIVMPNIARLSIQADGTDPLITMIMMAHFLHTMSANMIMLVAQSMTSRSVYETETAGHMAGAANVMMQNMQVFLKTVLHNENDKPSSGLLDASGSRIVQ